ncbi:hypothetical protein BAUCODRAFT_312886 [Baudoinia panamericana UAMH 10762]|uniref:Secreted protein n=1 Tax=Baudoinia panamericana (strain UAMH 10762) TaxID=717646 RepID=M2N0A7_BAUPA|nr:uncharacterized protein BAUCODRAFT_312886 [Baudoinia panamericana UAMH 10762]EMC91995.1 hypothetical protein BAUCODRAFT_312886 [Baudoinia panamericana UAMH 10762]
METFTTILGALCASSVRMLILRLSTDCDLPTDIKTNNGPFVARITLSTKRFYMPRVQSKCSVLRSSSNRKHFVSPMRRLLYTSSPIRTTSCNLYIEMMSDDATASVERLSSRLNGARM